MRALRLEPMSAPFSQISTSKGLETTSQPPEAPDPAVADGGRHQFEVDGPLRLDGDVATDGHPLRHHRDVVHSGREGGKRHRRETAELAVEHDARASLRRRDPEAARVGEWCRRHRRVHVVHFTAAVRDQDGHRVDVSAARHTHGMRAGIECELEWRRSAVSPVDRDSRRRIAQHSELAAIGCGRHQRPHPRRSNDGDERDRNHSGGDRRHQQRRSGGRGRVLCCRGRVLRCHDSVLRWRGTLWRCRHRILGMVRPLGVEDRVAVVDECRHPGRRLVAEIVVRGGRFRPRVSGVDHGGALYQLESRSRSTDVLSSRENRVRSNA